LAPQTKTGKNIPNAHKIYQMVINIPIGHKIYKHLLLQDPPKFTSRSTKMNVNMLSCHRWSSVDVVDSGSMPTYLRTYVHSLRIQIFFTKLFIQRWETRCLSYQTQFFQFYKITHNYVNFFTN
jgi:hypothetical protein